MILTHLRQMFQKSHRKYSVHENGKMCSSTIQTILTSINALVQYCTEEYQRSLKKNLPMRIIKQILQHPFNNLKTDYLLRKHHRTNNHKRPKKFLLIPTYGFVRIKLRTTVYRCIDLFQCNTCLSKKQ